MWKKDSYAWKIIFADKLKVLRWLGMFENKEWIKSMVKWEKIRNQA